MKRRVTVYRTKNINDMYLYVDEATDLEPVPELLLKRFGRPIEALRFELTPTRRLARADAQVVWRQLEEVGYFLQLPPSPEELSKRRD